VTIHPDEGLSGGEFVRWRISILREAAVQVPGKEEPSIFGIDMREAAMMKHILVVGDAGQNLAFT
jgi:hypothetical protein